MEVHHHGNHSGKKTWRSYFWEFLMLFLAVFCGFLAEYQLEHMIEKDREISYIKTYIEDLKSDTASINRLIKFREGKRLRMDSLMQLLESEQTKGHENDLYYLGRTLIRTANFISNDRTISQLKNSGSLRLIRSRQVADSMMVYESLVEVITSNQQDDRLERKDASEVLSKIFDPFIFDKMVSETGIQRITGNPPLRSYDRSLQLDLAYCLHQIKGSNFILLSRLKLLRNKATEMIGFMEKKYD